MKLGLILAPAYGNTAKMSCTPSPFTDEAQLEAYILSGLHRQSSATVQWLHQSAGRCARGWKYWGNNGEGGTNQEHHLAGSQSSICIGGRLLGKEEQSSLTSGIRGLQKSF